MQTQRPDSELLGLWGAGDRRAGSELLERHIASITRFFQNKVWNGYDDLVQQTFVGCVESRARFRQDSSFRTYLFGIANNILRRHFRTHSRRPDTVDLETTSVADLSVGPSTHIRKCSDRALVLEALRHIPVDYQVVLELHYWEELRAGTIAEIVGLSEPTVRTRLRRGRQLLEQRMIALASSPERYQETIRDLDEFVAGIAGAVEADSEATAD